MSTPHTNGCLPNPTVKAVQKKRQGVSVNQSFLNMLMEVVVHARMDNGRLRTWLQVKEMDGLFNLDAQSNRNLKLRVESAHTRVVETLGGHKDANAVTIKAKADELLVKNKAKDRLSSRSPMAELNAVIR